MVLETLQSLTRKLIFCLYVYREPSLLHLCIYLHTGLAATCLTSMHWFTAFSWEILTALMVGVGGKAFITNRGASLKDFVTTGEK